MRAQRTLVGPLVSAALKWRVLIKYRYKRACTLSGCSIAHFWCGVCGHYTLTWQGTERVKEFLVAKLKDTEAALKRSLDEKGLTQRQSASDQEVISFLDSRTQVNVT